MSIITKKKIEFTGDDIQLRYVTHASKKILINTNACFIPGNEKWDENQNNKIADQLRNQIIQDQLAIKNLITWAEVEIKHCSELAGRSKIDRGVITGVELSARLGSANLVLKILKELDESKTLPKL